MHISLYAILTTASKDQQLSRETTLYTNLVFQIDT